MYDFEEDEDQIIVNNLLTQINFELENLKPYMVNQLFTDHFTGFQT